MKQGRDPYKYFRVEAREILDGLTRGLLDLERAGGKDDEALGQCFRLAHTLKGAARVVKQLRIGEIAHSIEDALDSFRESGEPITVDYVTDLLRLLDIIRSELETIAAPSETTRPEPPSAPRSRDTIHAPHAHERFETLRIEVNEMDAILDGISEAAVQLLPLRSGADALAAAYRSASSTLAQVSAHKDSGRGAMTLSAERWLPRVLSALEEVRSALGEAQREIGAGLGRIEGELGELLAHTSALRLVPASEAFGSLELAARDAADLLGKRVYFEATGGETRLEGHILGALRDALLHIVRNAVDHGLEPPEEREMLGKPAAGTVFLRVERRGSRVAFVCSDDGRGINLLAVRRSAAMKGLIASSQMDSLSVAETLRLIFHAGVSTTPEVTEMSGRGVGLDVVREVTTRFKGEVRAWSEPGAGTKIEILVPMSLSSVTTLAVASDGATALVPLDAISGTFRLLDGDIMRNPEGDSILYEREAIPFVTLSAVLSSRAAPAAPEVWSAVVLEREGRRTAVGVERLLGTRDVFVKPLPAAAGPSKIVVGASFDAQGDPLLVLDPQGLIECVSKAAARARVSEPPKGPSAPVLIIDDSLTTRMLEQSILESAGYEVHLASSGEEGLKKAAERPYGLFIVDVEMPGINGFEFVARAKADPAIAHVPVIMVTSLSSAADRRRGAAVGVNAYVVKGEFDQKFFVRTVGELLGGGNA